MVCPRFVPVCPRLGQRCFELGLNVNRVGGPHSVWRLAPPLTIEHDEIDEATAIIDQALTEIPA